MCRKRNLKNLCKAPFNRTTGYAPNNPPRPAQLNGVAFRQGLKRDFEPISFEEIISA